jgi:hypothetical protein
VSGFGAFMAVAASFLLVRRNEAFQTEREKEKIEIDQWATDFFFSIRVLSKGLFPSTVKAAYLSSEGKGVVSLCNSLPQDLQITLPKRLECREDIQFACRIDQLNTLLENISWLQLEDLNLLRIHVITVTDEYVVPINQEIADFFLGAARGARIAILGTDEPF